MDLGRLLDPLDPAQREAVTTTAAPLAIVAAAGSGKTMVLTRRIAYRIATGTADAAHVLALTFSREAAGELRRRVRRLDIRQPIEAGTFHAVALRLLRDRALANNRAAPVVALDRRNLLADALGELRLRLDPSGVAADIDWARARRVTPSGYAAAVRNVHRRSTLPPARYADVVAAYEQQKRKRGVVDFDDMLEGMLSAMREPVYAEAIRWRFRHFFVDEAQDLNPLQHAVLEAWRGGRDDICLVGDPRQAIYGWNGSDPRLLADVETSYPGVTVVRLSTNYRCSPSVVRGAAAVLEQAGMPDDSVSDAPSGPPLQATTCVDEADEARHAAVVASTAAAASSANHVAVLARTHEQLEQVGLALAARGVATARGAGRSPFDRVLAEAYRMGARAELAEWAAMRTEHDDMVVRAVANEADRFLTSARTGTFRSWIEARQPFDDSDLRGGEAVTLATFHAAKGREWDHVVILGMNDGLVPHSSAVSAEQRAEEARLTYVAITRARRAVTLISTESRRGATAADSPWLAAIRTAGAAERGVPAPADLQRRPRVEDPTVPWAEWRHRIARAAGIEDEAVCPDHILRQMADDPPADDAELAQRMGITVAAAARLPSPPR